MAVTTTVHIECKSCKFWRPSRTREISEAGQCRRRAPYPDLHIYVEGGSKLKGRCRWPETRHNDWCGEFVDLNEEEDYNEE